MPAEVGIKGKSYDATSFKSLYCWQQTKKSWLKKWKKSYVLLNSSASRATLITTFMMMLLMLKWLLVFIENSSIIINFFLIKSFQKQKRSSLILSLGQQTAQLQNTIDFSKTHYRTKIALFYNYKIKIRWSVFIYWIISCLNKNNILDFSLSEKESVIYFKSINASSK